MSRRSGGGQGTRPGVAMTLCVLFALLAAAALYFAEKHQAPAPAPQPIPAPVVAPDPAAGQQAARVLDEDDRIEANVFGRPQDHPLPGLPTVVLGPQPQPYTLNSLIGSGTAHRVDAKTVDLLKSVIVAPGAVLDVEAPGTTLRLASGPGGFASIVGWQAGITLAGSGAAPLTITSWNQAAKGPDTSVADGRAYIRGIGADLSLHFVHATSLGFWSGRTGGVAITGIAAGAATGTISNTQVDQNHYGLYADDVAKLTVADSTFSHNELTGVLLHRGTTNAVVERTVAEANGADGFVADRGSESIVLRNLTATANQGDGVRLDGRPLAEDSGPAGASNVPHKDFRVEGSLVRANRDDGIRAVDGNHVVVTGNRVVGHQDGIVVTDGSVGVEISDNDVVGPVTAGIALRDGPSDVLVRANKVEGGSIGLQVRDARAELRDNIVSGATGHGVSVVGAAGGTIAEGNSLRGAGASALDVARLAPQAVVTLKANDDSGWKVEVPIGDYLSDLVRDHPLLPLWVLVLLAPLALIVLRRSRSSHPYIEGAGRPEPPATAHDGRGETLLLPRPPVRQSGSRPLQPNGEGPR
jgi:Right handed beta helix region